MAFRQKPHLSEEGEPFAIDTFTGKPPAMAAAMCLVGHIADDLDVYAMYEHLLVLPK